MDTFPSPPGIGVYHDLKWAMERVFAQAGDIEVRVALPSGNIGPGDLRLGTSALVVALARGDDPPHPDGIVSLVDPRDAAVGIARLAVRDETPARVILSAASVRLHPLMAVLARRYGVATPRAPLSASAARELADRSEEQALSTRTRAALVREIVDLVNHGVLLDGSLAERSLGVHYRHFSTSLADFEAWAHRLGFLNPPPEARP